MTEFAKKWKQVKAGLAALTIRWVVYAAPAISFVAWVSVHSVSILCGFSVVDLSEDMLIGTKITFLSIIVALGMFQYGYFYSESKELEHRLKRGDYGTGWAEYV